MASLLVRVCCLLACATALADEGEGSIVWTRHGRTRLHCPAAGGRLAGEGRRAPPPHLALVPEGGVGATATARRDLLWWRDAELLPHAAATLKAERPGVYRCGVRTSSGVVLAAEQHVRTPSLEKRFAQEPEDTSAAVGQPAALRCRIQSSPPANITWLRDHQPLPVRDRYHVLSSGDLIITAVTEGDSGRYSCNASNAYMANKTRGSRSASLAVTAGPASGEPAFLADDQPATLRLRVGEELLLPCLVTGWPRPEVEWQWSAGRGAVAGAAVSAGPVLRAVSAAPHHAGLYTCTVRDHKHLSKSWNVEVMRPARIVKAPESIHRPSASVVRFDCQADGAPEPRVTWYKNGEPLLLDGRVKVRMGPNGNSSRLQLVIGGAHPSDAGVYQCFAQSAGTEAATAWAVLGVAGGALPGPTGVRCSPLGLHSVHLEWKPVPAPAQNATPTTERPPDPDGKMPPPLAIYYTVHYVPADCTSGCKEQIKPSSAARMDVELEGEATRYQFYVRAYYGKDASNPSHKVTCQGQGVSVKVWKREEGVRVEWAEAAARLARGTRWLLQYRPRLAAAATDVALEPGTHQYLLPGVTSEDDYEVRLLATTTDDFLSQNLSGLAWTSTRDSLANNALPSDTSAEQKVVTVVPSGLTASGQWTRGLRVSWRCDPCENSTSAYSFVLCYKRSDPLRRSKENCINSDINELEVGSLEPGTQYEFRVQALLQRRRVAAGGAAAGASGAVVASGGGPFSDTLLATTLHDESRKIKKVFYNYTDDGLKIWWTVFDTESAAVDGASNSTVYTVHYSQNLTRPLDQWMQLNVTGKTSIELSGLASELKTFVVVSSRSRGQEEHGPVVDVPPRSSNALLPPYALLGVIAGAVVCVICLLCCIALFVWRKRKGARANTRPQRSGATADADGTEMTVRSGTHVNGDGRGADEPLLNGHVHGAGNPHAAKTTPNGRYKRPAPEAVFDMSRRDDPDSTLDTILELDISDLHPHARTRLHQQPDPSPRLQHRTPSTNKFPDDNMNSQTPLDFSQDVAPTLQPNG